MADLAANNPQWAGWIGPVSTFTSLAFSANSVRISLSAGEEVKAADVLAVVAGVADLSGNFLLKPGPQVIAGLVLKGLALSTSVAQNIVGDATIAELLGNGLTTKPIIPESLFPPKPNLIVFAPDGVSPLGTAISTQSGNGQTDVIWTQRTDGGFVKTETITMKDGAGTVQSVNFTQYSYSSGGTPLSADTYMYGKSGALMHSGALAPSADGL